ncbi:MAG: anaerobic ribonucleoside-triphosphate reductase activating protein [Clostridiales bacterium]|nr:anaerobic ribonucleoside-triphosphate reductase activating protein [Clostridiales bacterium]
MKIKLAGLVKESVVDGPGIRMAVFTQGCARACPGCHNPNTQDFAGGEWHDTGEIWRQFAANRHLRGLTISGGEPFAQAAACADLARMVKENGKDVVVYTGYTWEELLESGEGEGEARLLLENTDILVDGPFVEALKNLDLPFRGSSNQRVIDVAASLAAGRTVVMKWGREARAENGLR